MSGQQKLRTMCRRGPEKMTEDFLDLRCLMLGYGGVVLRHPLLLREWDEHGHPGGATSPCPTSPCLSARLAMAPAIWKRS